MANDSGDLILSTLKRYEQDSARNDKKAVLLMPQAGYFLYGNRFCSIQDYELELVDAACQIQGSCVSAPIFLGVLQDGFHAVGAKRYTPEWVSLIFHIDLGADELLRGILSAIQQEARFALFCDAAVEDVYRLSRKRGACPSRQVPPEEALQQQAEELRRNDLHSLTGLYLQGKQLKYLPTVDGTSQM